MKSGEHSIFDSLLMQKDNNDDNSRLSREMQIFACIYHGDMNRLNDFLNDMKYNQVIVGKLSDDPLKQAKYIAVSFATLAYRIAITGGIIETAAYKESDRFINEMDKLENPEEIYQYILKTVREITQAVHNVHYSINYSSTVKECTNYIYNHVCEKITLTQLSEMCKLTPSYLSSLFKKETGMTISDYIMKEKMKEATNLLLSGKYSCIEISNQLGFCSQSYFCKCFKTQYGVTPLEFIENPLSRTKIRPSI